VGLTGFLVIASAVLGLAAAAPYIRDVRRRRTVPQAASWLAWSALFTVAGASALDAGQVPAAACTLACAAGAAVIAVLALRYGDRAFSALDGICLAGAAAGLALLLAARSPALAVTATLAVDAVAYVPTAVHAWRIPREETWSTYAMSATGAGMALAAAAIRIAPGLAPVAGMAYPAYLLAADGGVAVMIAARRWRTAVVPLSRLPGHVRS